MTRPAKPVVLRALGPDGVEIDVRVDYHGRIVASPAKTSVHNSTAADVLLAVPAQAGLRLVGFSAREVASTPAVATFRLINGPTVLDGDVTLPIELGANQSTSDWFGDGIDCADGITIDRIAGTFDLLIYYKVG